MQKKNIYDAAVLKEIKDRIEKLTPDTQPQWGTMTVAQMLAHCSEIQEVSNGKPLQDTPFIVNLFKGMIRKMVVGDKPYPRNSRTHPQYVQSDEREFGVEKSRLLSEIDKSYKDPQKAPKTIHPLFGEMTPAEKGWAGYKHLDHHLAQFGV